MGRRLFLIGLGAVLFVSACGGKTESFSAVVPSSAQTPGTAAQLIAALDRTAAEQTARMRYEMTYVREGTPLSFGGSGVIDFDTGAAQMTFSAPGTEELEFRWVDDVAYIREGSEWSSATGVRSMITSPAPSSTLSYLRGVGDVTTGPTESLRGVETTRYDAVTDLGRLVSQSGGQQHPLVDQLHDVVGDVKMPISVWLDDEDVVRKFTIELDMKKAAAAVGWDERGAMKLRIVSEFYDFGIDVDVQAPQASTSYDERGAQSELRNALTAEKTEYTDTQAYTDDTATLRAIESSLDWGGKLRVGVSADAQVVCLERTAADGTTLSIGDVAFGAQAGTYYGKDKCPAEITAASVASIGDSW